MDRDEQNVYADFVMGMHNRGMHEYDGGEKYPDDKFVAKQLYGKEVYAAIRTDFTRRIHARLNRSENRSVEERLP